MNYLEFSQMPLLDKQPMVTELYHVYTMQKFPQVYVNAYNKYTEEFNTRTSRSAQEFFLNQRHKYLIECMEEMDKGNIQAI